jgi:hypothetical protein
MNKMKAFQTIDKHLNLWDKSVSSWRFNRENPVPGLGDEYYQDIISVAYDRTSLGLIVPSFGTPGVLVGLRVKVLQSAFTWGSRYYSTDIDPEKFVITYRLVLAEDLGSNLTAALDKLRNIIGRLGQSNLIFEASGAGGSVGNAIREIHKTAIPTSSHDGNSFAKTVAADRAVVELGRSAMLSDFATAFEEMRIKIPESVQSPARSRLWQQMGAMGIARTTAGNAVPTNRKAGSWDVERNDALFAAAMAVSFSEFQINRFARAGAYLHEIP